jgi:hypothetical protein
MSPYTLRRVAVPAALFVLFFAGCSDESALTDPNKLCARGAGLAARISGTPDPIDFCVANDQALATYTSAENRYRVTAIAMSDSIEVTIAVSFQIQPGQPLNLHFFALTPTRRGERGLLSR